MLPFFRVSSRISRAFFLLFFAWYAEMQTGKSQSVHWNQKRSSRMMLFWESEGNGLDDGAFLIGLNTWKLARELMTSRMFQTVFSLEVSSPHLKNRERCGGERKEIFLTCSFIFLQLSTVHWNLQVSLLVGPSLPDFMERAGLDQHFYNKPCSQTGSNLYGVHTVIDSYLLTLKFM